MQIYQPKSSLKNTHKHKVPVKHQELQHSIQWDKLNDQKWVEEINKELVKFQQLIHQIEEIQSQAAQEDNLMSQGSHKLITNDYKYTQQKLITLQESINVFKKNLEGTIQNKGKPKQEYVLTKERDYIQLQFMIAHRVLAFIEVYIKLQDQYQDQHELQKHRDYILQKIAKIKQQEEKHQKKLHHYYTGIVVGDSNDENIEQQVEQQVEQEYDDDDDDEQDEDFQHSQKEELIKLCDCLISYLKTFVNKEDVHRINYDLVTLQQFDQIQVAAPFHYDKINITLELITAKKTYYENVSEAELLKKQQIKEDQKQKALDINDEKDFPKLE